MGFKLCIGTKKGGFILSSDNRKDWKLSEPILFGHVIYHMVPDPRDTKTILIATRTGHLGPTIIRTHDGGKTWIEAKQPPAFSKESGKSVDFVFWLTPGHSSEPDVWFAGTSPQSVFKSEDKGNTWKAFDQFNKHDIIMDIIASEQGTPAGPLTHSINIHAKDKQKMVVALSTGGVFLTEDGGESWIPRNQNLLAEFLPNKYPEYGQCVHNMQMAPTNPNIIYQQNHCGVYRINLDEDKEWENIGANLPIETGETSDRGFPIIVHPRDANQMWTIPMDGSDVWPRTSVAGKPALYHTTNGGKNWTRQDRGLPSKNSWFTVLRQASAHDNHDPLGLFFGNRAGDIWFSGDEGNSWNCIKRSLPEIYSLEIFSD